MKKLTALIVALMFSMTSVSFVLADTQPSAGSDAAAAQQAPLSKLAVSKVKYPRRIYRGATFDIRGIVTSNQRIKSVAVRIYNSQGKMVRGRARKASSYRYDLKNIDRSIVLNTLKTGTYTFIIRAKDARQVKTLVKSSLVVKSSGGVSKKKTIFAGWQWPNKRHYLMGGYGGSGGHPGIDIGGSRAVYPTASGIAVYTGRHSTMGNYIIVRHKNGYYTAYLHLKTGSIKIKRGQLVDKTTRMATMGSTGRSSANHIHLEVGRSTCMNRYMRCRVNPMTAMP